MTAQPRPDPVDRLLADLAGDVAETPPNRLRSAVLAAVRADQQAAPWPPADTLPGPARPLARQAQALDALLADLTAGGWGRPVLNDWSTAQVVGHLLAVDGLCAAALGLPVPPEAGGPVRPDDPLGWDVQRRTATVFDRAAGGPVRVGQVWRAQLVAVLRHAAAGGEVRMAQPVRYLGLDLSVGDTLLDRGFETWVHLEDLRAAHGRPTVDPEPADAHLMADLGIRLLPLTWPSAADPAAGPGTPSGAVELTLTGAGGGSWLVGPAGAGAAAATGSVTLDVVDFCRLAGGRMAVDAVPHGGTADAALARVALQAAAALARL